MRPCLRINARKQTSKLTKSRYSSAIRERSNRLAAREIRGYIFRHTTRNIYPLHADNEGTSFFGFLSGFIWYGTTAGNSGYPFNDYKSLPGLIGEILHSHARSSLKIRTVRCRPSLKNNRTSAVDIKAIIRLRETKGYY